MDHEKEFDGIKQADNALPNWWKNFFGISIIFAIVYSVYFHFFSNWGMEKEFENASNAHAIAFPKKEVVANEDGSNPLRDNKDAIEAGKKNFMTVCVACHGPEGKGLVGPNLMDAEWIHGSSDVTVYEVISKGLGPEKVKLNRGIMPAHSQLGSDKIYEIMAWISANNPSLKRGK
ncbi:MAG: cbb3-type cytochrome c oxidase N-terminal domain-containing protein [Leptospiraceae bacterium]|nr:cbb3-type cytochrome c oxidase N-terminal domain-containing protein [Leptospiraceae bacterium]